MKKTIISAIALSAVTLAGAQTSKNLVVTDRDGEVKTFPAEQVQSVIFQEQPEYRALTHVLRTAYEEVGDLGYYTIEMGTDASNPADGTPLEINGMQVALKIAAPKTADMTQPVLPTGYYRVGNGSQPWTFDVNTSSLWLRIEDGEDGVAPTAIVDGTLDVRMDENGEYDIRMEFITFSYTADLRYVGELEMAPGYGEFGDFQEDVNLDYTRGQGRFYGNWYYPFVSDLTLEFYNANISADGYFQDGYVLYLDFYEPKQEDEMAPVQRVADGVYEVETRDDVKYTQMPYRYNAGKYIDFLGQSYLTGTRLEYTAPDGRRRLGRIVGGTFTVSENGTKFEFNLVTDNDINITGTYEGTPLLQNFCDNDQKAQPRPYSTLTGDKTLEFVDGTVAYSYSDGPNIMPDRNNVTLMICKPEQNAGDYIQLTLMSETDDVPDGTYEFSRMPEAGKLIEGQMGFGGEALFSWYGDLTHVDENGYQLYLAPMTSGTVTVSTNEDGSRKVAFNVVDDNDNTISGEYNGVLLDLNQEMNSAKVRKLKKMANRKVRSPKAARRGK